MFCIWVTLTIDPADRAEFVEAITDDATCSVRDEPGCIGFDVIELDAAAGKYALYERYVDEHAFQGAHRESAHFARYRVVADRLIREQNLVTATVLVDRHS